MFRELEILPNPAKDFLLLKYPGNPHKLMKVDFFSGEGVLVMKVNVDWSDSDSFLLDIRGLTPGTYFLNISCDGQNQIGKLVIM